MRSLTGLLIFVICLLWADTSFAQEITPRLFWPAPKGTKVFVSGYSFAQGDVLFDTSIPIEDADSAVNTGILAYAQTIDFFGRTSSFLVELPYSWGKTKGLLEGNPAEREFSGAGDLAFTLNVNLLGAPSMSMEDFLAFRAKPRPIIGASVKIVAPTGEYYEDRLVNVGANRWAVRAKLGGVLLFNPHWLLELSAGAWFFGDNDKYVTGKREQDPIYSLESNLIKRIRPGLWASLDVTYYTGGRQTVGGDPLRDKQSNVKVGGTFVFPFRQRHAIKIGYANGVITRYGNAFDQFIVSYQMILK
jgi:hypothetical protein